MASTSTVASAPSVAIASSAGIATKILPPTHHQVWRAPTQEAALPLHVQSLERSLDVSIFINQLEKLLSTPFEAVNVTERRVSYGEAKQGQTMSKKSLLTSKGIWEDDQARKRDLSCLYNFSTLGKRKWLKNVLLEDSDSDSDVEQVITDRDLKILLKIHKYRRKYQKRYHTDILNSQYTYFGAGLLSEHDRFPDHQRFILSEYGFTVPAPPPPVVATALAATISPVSPVKRPPVKRRRNSQRSVSNTGEIQGKLLQKTSSVTSVGSEAYLAGNGHPSSSSEFNSPISSPSPYPYFAVPLVRLPSTSTASILVDGKPTAAAIATIPSLVRPVAEPSAGDFSPGALRWRAWKAIAIEDIPKAHTERIIQRKYQSVVLKQIALYCVQFLEQAREAAVTGKHKAGGRHGKKQHHGGNYYPVGLRPVSKQQHQGTSYK